MTPRKARHQHVPFLNGLLYDAAAMIFRSPIVAASFPRGQPGTPSLFRYSWTAAARNIIFRPRGAYEMWCTGNREISSSLSVASTASSRHALQEQALTSSSRCCAIQEEEHRDR